MGPFNTPWLTFSAFIVVAGSILASIWWALNDIKQNSDKE